MRLQKFSYSLVLFTSFILIPWFFIANPISSSDFHKENNVLEGIVLGEDQSGLDGMRIQVVASPSDVSVSATSPARSDLIYATYSRTMENQTGYFSLQLPAFRTAVLSISGRGCRRYETILTSENGHPPEKISYSIKKGLDSLPRFSLDEAQLFVTAPNQVAIERSIENKYFAQLEYFIKNQIPEEKHRKWAYRFAGHLLFIRGLESQAEHFFALGQSQIYGNLMGDQAIEKGDYISALSYYRNSECTPQKAYNLTKAADFFEKTGDSAKALESLETAVRSYEIMFNSLRYIYQEDFLKEMIITRDKLLNLSDRMGETNPSLRSLLHMAAHYCRQLELRSIHYFCKEAKSDQFAWRPSLYESETENYPFFVQNLEKVVPLYPNSIFTYTDLQIIHLEDGTYHEERKVIRQRIKDRKEKMEINSYSINMAVYGPNTLIGDVAQQQYSYLVVDEERLFNQDTIVLETIPRKVNIKNFNTGRLWVNKKDGSILKIEWKNMMMPNRQQLRLRGLILDLEPRIRYISEYGFEKNGFWYPSRNSLAETYIDDQGQEIWSRVVMETLYKNYRFFGVASKYSVEKINLTPQ